MLEENRATIFVELYIEKKKAKPKRKSMAKPKAKAYGATIGTSIVEKKQTASHVPPNWRRRKVESSVANLVCFKSKDEDEEEEEEALLSAIWRETRPRGWGTSSSASSSWCEDSRSLFGQHCQTRGDNIKVKIALCHTEDKE